MEFWKFILIAWMASVEVFELDIAIVVVAARLVEECVVYLGQQHSGNKAVVVAVVVKDSTI